MKKGRREGGEGVRREGRRMGGGWEERREEEGGEKMVEGWREIMEG